MVQPSRRVFKDPMAMNLSDKSAQSNNTSEAEDEEEKKREETQYRLTTMKKKRVSRKELKGMVVCAYCMTRHNDSDECSLNGML